MSHQHPILLSPRLDEGTIRLPIVNAPPQHRLPPRLADLTGWYISEDGSELVLHDGSVEPESPFADMVTALDGILPDMRVVSYDEDQNITFCLTRGLITELECRHGKGRVTTTPFQQFIARAKYISGPGQTQDWNPRLQLLLELCSRPAQRTTELVAWATQSLDFEIDVRLDATTSGIADLFSTGRLLQLLDQLARVGGDPAVIAQLRARVDAKHGPATAALLDVLRTARPADPDAALVARHLGPASQLEHVLALVGPGAFPRGIELWPAATIAAASPAELLEIGAQGSQRLYLDTRYLPARVVVHTGTSFEEQSDDLLGHLAFELGSERWKS